MPLQLHINNSLRHKPLLKCMSTIQVWLAEFGAKQKDRAWNRKIFQYNQDQDSDARWHFSGMQ